MGWLGAVGVEKYSYFTLGCSFWKLDRKFLKLILFLLTLAKTSKLTAMHVTTLVVNKHVFFLFFMLPSMTAYLHHCFKVQIISYAC